MRRYTRRLFHRLGAGYMDDLNYGNPSQGLFQIAMCADRQVIADLDRIRSAKALLFDDVCNSLPRCEQECPDGRGNGRGYLEDLLIADDPGTARHAGNQAQCGRSTLNRQSGFVNTADATDFYSWRARSFHKLLLDRTGVSFVAFLRVT